MAPLVTNLQGRAVHICCCMCYLQTILKSRDEGTQTQCSTQPLTHLPQKHSHPKSRASLCLFDEKPVIKSMGRGWCKWIQKPSFWAAIFCNFLSQPHFPTQLIIVFVCALPVLSPRNIQRHWLQALKVHMPGHGCLHTSWGCVGWIF